MNNDLKWIGVMIEKHDKWLIVKEVLENTPAKKFWLKNQDIIISAN